MSDGLIFVAGAAFGSALTGALVHHWYDKILYRRMYARGWRWIYKGAREDES
ncbi:MAG TPA: hypothetical protein HA263_08085 [Methanoregulaceae archaeon]|nr:hypothetical protein [Methanoregulaceae archaeon]